MSSHGWQYMLSRSLWTAKLLGVRENTAPLHENGIVLLQIDGLSFKQFNIALQKGRMPFLQSAINNGSLVLKDMYSGLPSTTPAVQAEIIYGVKTAVPAFQYYDRTLPRIMTMYEAESVEQVAGNFPKADSLLINGASFGNVYSGDADFARFCAQTVTMQSVLKRLHPLRLALLMLLHFYTAFRIIGLILLEFIIALKDFLLGAPANGHPIKELKFIPARVGVCILLRELTRFYVKMNIARGVLVIMANFLGYDEQAHRRGPDSGMAHWSLKGIDAVIKDIWCSSVRNKGRHFEIAIYADHGQEKTAEYAEVAGQTLDKAVSAALSVGPLSKVDVQRDTGHFNFPMLYERAKAMVHNLQPSEKSVSKPGSSEIVITAMGPLGHIYVPLEMSKADREFYAKRLVEIAAIPLVLIADEAGTAIAYVEQKSYRLPDEVETLFGADHPFLPQVAEDLTRVVHHPHAGDFVISGWRRNLTPLTFPVEGGSHAGPGQNEIHSFALFPSDSVPDEDPVRPLTIRHWAQSVRGFRSSVGNSQ